MGRPGQTVTVKDAWFKDMDDSSAQNAKAAIGALVGDQGLDGLRQTDLQVFLWYTMPTKWIAETSEHHEVAWSLGDALRNAGLDRYAELCRAAQTHLIIDSYAVSRATGFAAYRKAAESSGIEPPETDVMQWGPVMGPAEYAVRDRLSSRLEEAVVAGEMTPGSRGWKKVAQRIAEDFLSSGGQTVGGRVRLSRPSGSRGGAGTVGRIGKRSIGRFSRFCRLNLS